MDEDAEQPVGMVGDTIGADWIHRIADKHVARVHGDQAMREYLCLAIADALVELGFTIGPEL